MTAGDTQVNLTVPTRRRRAGFVCALVVRDDLVIEADRIIGFMRRWTADMVRKFCADVGWKATVKRAAMEQTT
jgi:hypothetical protein